MIFECQGNEKVDAESKTLIDELFTTLEREDNDTNYEINS